LFDEEEPELRLAPNAVARARSCWRRRGVGRVGLGEQFAGLVRKIAAPPERAGGGGRLVRHLAARRDSGGGR